MPQRAAPTPPPPLPFPSGLLRAQENPTPALLQSQGSDPTCMHPAHPEGQPHPLATVCVPRVTQATELHGRMMARPGLLLSWPLDTAWCCHNITKSWASTSNQRTGPLQSPEGRSPGPLLEEGGEWGRSSLTRCSPLSQRGHCPRAPASPQTVRASPLPWHVDQGFQRCQVHKGTVGLLGKGHLHSAGRPGRRGAGWRAGTPSGTGRSLSAVSGTLQSPPAAGEKGERLG